MFIGLSKYSGKRGLWNRKCYENSERLMDALTDTKWRDNINKIYYYMFDSIERSIFEMREQYEVPEVEFVELDETDIVTASGCTNPNGYGGISHQ